MINPHAGITLEYRVDHAEGVTNYLFLFLKTSWVFFQSISAAMEVRAFMELLFSNGAGLGS